MFSWLLLSDFLLKNAVGYEMKKKEKHMAMDKSLSS